MAWEKTVNDLSAHSFFNDQRKKWSFITEHSPWMGVFYDGRLVGATKMVLKKSIDRVSLTSSQLQTILTEAVIITKPLIHGRNDMVNQITIIISTFSLNKHKGRYISTDGKEWRWKN